MSNRALFTDTVTVFNQVSDNEWRRTVVKGVQWTDKVEKSNSDGVISILQYASVTFPKGTYENITLSPGSEQDCIILGAVEGTITTERGQRVSDLLKQYPRSGLIKSVKDNSLRRHLKNKKVVLV